MRNVIKFCILSGVFVFFLTPLNAATDFCLEKDGFIYPLITENECENSSDERLKLEEYRFIRDFENKDRYQKLVTYREDLLKEKQEELKKAQDERIIQEQEFEKAKQKILDQ